MEPEVTGAATLKKVTISSSALMKIVQHGTRSLPELCAGSLLGLDDGEGRLEISDCFAYPSSNAITAGAEDDDDAAAQAESDVAEFREDMLRLLRDCNSEEFSVGWYRTVNMGDWCNANIIEQQFEHQDECDQGTGKAKSVLILYDPYQTDKGVLSIKAVRLTDAFMEIMRVRASQEPGYAVASVIALSKLRMSDVFYEIPIEFEVSSTLAQIALTELRVGSGSTQASAELSNVGLDRLVLATDPYLEKNVTFAIEELDNLKDELQFQKQVAKQKQGQDKWAGQRRQENMLRDSKLASLLVRKQIDIYCDQINDWAAQSFEKLYLVGAVQQQHHQGGASGAGSSS